MSELAINWEKLTLEERIKELKGGKVSPESLEVLSSIPRTFDHLEEELRSIMMDYQDITSTAIDNLVIKNTDCGGEFEFMEKVINHPNTSEDVLEFFCLLDTESEDSVHYNDDDVNNIKELARQRWIY
jgi:chemotaxis regulatin CheY-phosphate phosphatase CheZ|tara:strand:+ start:108 stop:491 length:384 start_codon:yes stop_codon:yes gene_type:complete